LYRINHLNALKNLVVVVFFIFFVSPLRAQTGTPCAGMQFPYAYVTPSCNLTYHCAENPNGQNGPDSVVRWANGSTIHYATDYPSQGACVNSQALDQCIDNAFCDWTRLCGSDGDIYFERDPFSLTQGDLVPITVKSVNDSFTYSTHEFGDDKQTIGSVVAVTHIDKQCNGKIYAENPGLRGSLPLEYFTFIDVNATPTAKAQFTDVYPCPNSDCPGNGRVDLCKAVTHEIGHLLGLQHVSPSYVEQEEGVPVCSNTDTVGMWNALMDTVMNQPCDGSPPNFSVYDQCMYEKLYCYGHVGITSKGGAQPLDASCSNSSVNEGTPDPTFDPALVVFPNPTTGILTVQYSTNMPGLVSIRIFNTLGEQMMIASYQENPGHDSHTVNLSKLPAGQYIVRISSVDMRDSRLIAITN
jgi:Secretion system C-terminal sorting domain